MTPEQAIQAYQCPGCVNGPYPDCFEKDVGGVQCVSHCAGTMISGIGSIFLGLPKGFHRKGPCNDTKIWIFESLSRSFWMPYDKFNVPVWKHLDKHGSTVIRGICPQTNDPWIHIFLEDCMSFIDCIEITEADINEMD